MSSLYVHVPFCKHICSYCDFCKVFYHQKWAWQYLEALSYEIQDKKLLSSYDTVYIGGGTPTALDHRQLERLFQILSPYTQKSCEYSIEMNPETVDQEKLALCQKYGVNRLSIGVQTFHDHLLQNIGRQHTCKQAQELIKQAQSLGLEDINVDLIYGLPQQTWEDVQEDLEQLDLLNVHHVSLYSLILEDHTILKNQNYQSLDDETDALWYQRIRSILKEKGFTQYEVSNFYRHKPSLHNLVYWHYQDYEGIGLSAHSLKEHCRYENTRSLTQYLQHHYNKEKIPLKAKDEQFEKIMMGLRLTCGIDIEEMNRLFSIDFLTYYRTVIEKYQKLQMLTIENQHLMTTPLGMNFLNNILVDFLEEPSY